MKSKHWLLRYLVLGGIALYEWPVPRRSFDELYDGDPAIAASLRAFRQIPLRRLEVDGYDWTYYLAQYFAANYPARVEAAVFANTYPPNDLLGERNRQLGKLLPLVPEWLLMYALRRNVRQVVVPAAQGSPLVKAYLLEQGYGKMSREQFYARFRCVVDRFEGRVPDGLPLQIIESDNDPMIPPELRTKLRERYPQALVHTFHGKGHFPYLNEAGGYTDVLRSFL